MKMDILFITAPVQLYDDALRLIEDKKFKNLLIVTVEELSQFFKEHTNADVVVPKVNPNLITLKTKGKILSNLIQSRREYKRLFVDIKGARIYFAYTLCSIVYFSYIKKLAKNNKVYFYGNTNIKYGEKEKGIVATIMQLAVKIMLGIDVFVERIEGTRMFELDLSKFTAEQIQISSDVDISKTFVDTRFLKGKDVLFLGDDLVGAYKDEEEIIELTNKLVDLFVKEFGSSFIVKAHPRDKKLYGKMSGVEQIEPTTIVETLYGHKWRYVVSYQSVGLLTAKESTDATVISLLNLYKWNDEEWKSDLKVKFKSKGILVPKTFDRLKEILKGRV